MGKKLLFVLNSILAVLSLCLFLAAYIPPSMIPYVSGITLIAPIVLVLNIFFLVFWLLLIDKRGIVSFLVLLLNINNLIGFCQLNRSKEAEKDTHNIKMMTFNTHGLNGFTSDGKRVDFSNDFVKFLTKEKIDILFTQETLYYKLKKIKTHFKYVTQQTEKIEEGSNYILSNYPIIARGNVGLHDMVKGRDITFADIQIKSDTLRFYNVHLSSFGFDQNAERLQKKGAKSLVKRSNIVFGYQEEQVVVLKKHIKQSPYPVVIAGDFNNNIFSYIYKQLLNSADLKDTFVEKGSGFGSTFHFKYFPTRIDYILVPKHTKVWSHRVHRTKNWSDHYPVLTTLSF